MRHGFQLGIQLIILAVCGWLVFLFATQFPFPSPVIQPFLSPEKRWPTAEVRHWIQSGHINDDYLAFFMRDPDRNVPPGRNIVAAADGEVIDIVHKPSYTYFVIGLTFWDVHVQRSPAAGTVTGISNGGNTFMDASGRNLNFLPDKFWPVQKIITIKTRWGKMIVRLVSSLSARRFRVFVHKGQKLRKGQRIGRILLGSEVVVQLPPRLRVLVKKGQRITAGETIVAR